MFKKSERITRTAFTQYFKIGRRFHTDFFTLIYSPAPMRGVAVVVGKKVFKEAVDRNTLRRRVYAAARTSLQTSTGIYLIIAKPTAKNLNQKDVAPAIAELLATALKAR
ncbi:MAG: ribonuclease P protein component [Patescibacteria group bacterium]